MSLLLTVALRTEVLESNPDCTFTAAQEQGALVIRIDTRRQNVHQRLHLPTRTPLHWGKTHEFEVQELSGLLWPIRYRVVTQDGYYLKDGRRVHFTTQANGLNARCGVSDVMMRAAVLLFVVAGIGYRRVAWLMAELFHVSVSKSALHRWVGIIAESLPNPDDIIRALDAQQPIRAGHLDELFPVGSHSCVLVLKDEHGRILATEDVKQRDETTVKRFLERFKALGLNFQAFYIDGCQAYYNAIRAVFGEHIAIQYDYFHILQNVWRHLWKWALRRRRLHQQRSAKVATPWYKAKLEWLVKSLWDNRYLLFTADANLTEAQRAKLAEILKADQQISRLRAFLGGVWHLFEDSRDAEQAHAALMALKALPVDNRDKRAFQNVIDFLTRNFEWMTAYLRYPGVQRNSLAETGMRLLRRLENEHDGFRTPKGRSRCLRIYQCVKYLGWKVHRPPMQTPVLA